MNSSEVIEVIKSSFVVGQGTKEDPSRMVTAFFYKSGELIAEFDHWKPSIRSELINFRDVFEKVLS